MSILSDRLKMLRGPTPQSQFAMELGMKQQQYARYEKGTTVPGADILANICRIHAVSADWLLGLDQKPPSAITINGNMNAVAQGPGARAVSTSKLPPGELPQCAKCPHRKLAEKMRRIVG